VICPKCSIKLRVSTVYAAGESSKTARAECARCDKVYTLVTFLVCEANERGQGAYALAKRLEKRARPPELDI
jgi:hypothetical protein